MTELEMWLKQATRQLSKDSAAQVRAEIRDHYESARDAAIVRGSSIFEANQAALASLGDPYIANRQYRKVLLTAGEASLLRGAKWEAKAFCAWPWLTWAIRLVAVAALCVSAFAFASGATRPAGWLAFVSTLIGIFVAAPTLPLYTPRRAHIFRWAKWPIVIAVAILAFGFNTIDWSSAFTICFGGFFWSEWAKASIRRKLPIEKWPRQIYL